MKQEEILAEAYIKTLPLYGSYPNLISSRNIHDNFIAGFNAGKKLRWNDVNEKLPKSDYHCLVYVENKEKPQWSGFQLGCYQGNNWYLQNGRKIHEIVTKWIKIT